MKEGFQANLEGEQKYNNVAVRLLVGKHYLDTESRYAEYRKNVETFALSFFKRGFNNIVFLENATSVPDENAEETLKKFNSYALSKRSFRKAYWRLGGASEGKAEQMVHKLDRQPISTFSKLLGNPDLSELEAKSVSFTYATYAALDGILRKGIDVVVQEEEFTKNRAELSQITRGYGDIPTYMRRLATSCVETDVSFAQQITKILDNNPSRTRVLGIMGAAHSRVIRYLPKEIGEVQVTSFTDEPNRPEVQIIHDLQDGIALTDQEILERRKLASR